MIKKLLPYLIGGVIVTLLVTMQQWGNNSVDIAQAQAAIEAARAAQSAAEAAKVAAGGLADVARMNAFLLGVVVLLAAALAVAVGYLWFTRQQALIVEQRTQAKRWLPGPNAGWRKSDELPRPTPQAAMQAGDPMSQLVTLMVLEKLGAMQQLTDQVRAREPRPTPAPALPAEIDDDGLVEF
jgi:hypothetical protein